MSNKGFKDYLKKVEESKQLSEWAPKIPPGVAKEIEDVLQGLFKRAPAKVPQPKPPVEVPPVKPPQPSKPPLEVEPAPVPLPQPVPNTKPSTKPETKPPEQKPVEPEVQPQTKPETGTAKEPKTPTKPTEPEVQPQTKPETGTAKEPKTPTKPTDWTKPRPVVPVPVPLPSTDEPYKWIKGNVWQSGGTDPVNESLTSMDSIQKSLKIIESMTSAEKNSTGPKFPGYWRGTDPASKAKDRMVGGSEEQQESVLGELDKTAKDSVIRRQLEEKYKTYKEATGDATIDSMIDRLSKGEEPKATGPTSSKSQADTSGVDIPSVNIDTSKQKAPPTTAPAPSSSAQSAEKTAQAAIDKAATSSQAAATSAEKAAATSAEKAAEKAAAQQAATSAEKAAGGAIAKGIGKSAARLVPGLGLGLGLVDAYGRAKEGDWTGAGLSGLAGLASTVPGWGTAAATGLTAAQIARDVYKAGQQPNQPTSSPDDQSQAETERLKRAGASKQQPPAPATSAANFQRTDKDTSSKPLAQPVTAPAGEGQLGKELAQYGISRADRRDQAFVDKELGTGYKAGSAEANYALLAKRQQQSGQPVTVPSITSTTPLKPIEMGPDDEAYKKAIAQREGAGRYDSTFGDKVDPKTGKVVHQFMPPHKPIDQMTMQELQDWQKERSKKDPGTGAVGLYGFMPGTVREYSAKLGLKPDELFNAATQEKIQNAIMADQRAILEKNKIPVNPGTMYMAHYIGPTGAVRVMQSTDPNQAVVDAMIDPKYKSNPEAYQAERNKILLRNPKLGKWTAGEFQQVMAQSVAQGQAAAQRQQAQQATQVAMRENDDKKVAGRYSYDEFDDMIDRLRVKAKAQEKKQGPVDLGKLMQKLRDIDNKDQNVKEEEAANIATNPDRQATNPNQQDTQAGQQATSQAGTLQQQQQRRDQALDTSTARGVADTIASVAPPGTNPDALAQGIVNANDGKPLTMDQQRAMSTITPLVLKAAETPVAAGALKTALQQAGILAKQGK